MNRNKLWFLLSVITAMPIATLAGFKFLHPGVTFVLGMVIGSAIFFFGLTSWEERNER